MNIKTNEKWLEKYQYTYTNRLEKNDQAFMLKLKRLSAKVVKIMLNVIKDKVDESMGN